MVGKLKEVQVREVWRHEAHDFTTWLEENIEILNEVLGLEITNADREQPAGSFNVDLLCETANGELIVIENQLERSNHDHLGKVITYLTSFDAQSAIWIVTEPRPEHVKAIIWLNESSAASFYLLKVTAVKIDNSQPAPLFTLIAGPSEEAKQVAVTKKDHSLRNADRQQFWSELLEKFNAKSGLFTGVSAGSGRRYIGSTRSLPSGLGAAFSLLEHSSSAQIYIDDNRDLTGQRNGEIFEIFYSDHKVIETNAGFPINWERLDGRRACRVSITSEGGWKDKGNWRVIQDDLCTKMLALEKAIQPYLKNI